MVSSYTPQRLHLPSLRTSAAVPRGCSMVSCKIPNCPWRTRFAFPGPLHHHTCAAVPRGWGMVSSSGRAATVKDRRCDLMNSDRISESSLCGGRGGRKGKCGKRASHNLPFRAVVRRRAPTPTPTKPYPPLSHGRRNISPHMLQPAQYVQHTGTARLS